MPPLLKTNAPFRFSMPSPQLPSFSPFFSSSLFLRRRSSFLSPFRFLSLLLTPLSFTKSSVLLSRPVSPSFLNSPSSSSSRSSSLLFKEASSSSLARRTPRRENQEAAEENLFSTSLFLKNTTSEGGSQQVIFFTPFLSLGETSPRNKEEEGKKTSPKSTEIRGNNSGFGERRKKDSEEKFAVLFSERKNNNYTMEGSAAAVSSSSSSYMGGFDPKDRGQAGDVVLVSTLSDNYAYLLIDRDSKDAACVDPAEPRKVLEAVKKEGVQLKIGLCTHKHLDHSGGNLELRDLCPGIEMVGSGYEETPGINKRVKDGDVLHLGSLKIEVLHAPCHTGGHLLYYVTSTSNPNLSPILFTGDTLFVGGCGRFFEGTADQMARALLDVIAPLPPQTKIYCGHEYTLANLQFAMKVEPKNENLQEKYRWAAAQREANKPTIPSSIEQEKKFNPFMRVDEKSVQEAVGSVGDKVETMKRLREMKNKS